jgi:A/G-specific adenine glycosylase
VGAIVIKKNYIYLLNWFQKHGRHELPWRKTTDIYHIFLSEVMLQQTQVSRVKEHFYPHFLKKYPTLQSLASATLDEILADWSGLGYYSRARNLHKAVQLCVEDGLPTSMAQLQKLPGVGRYTASAVCSFALNQHVAVIDTNITRVLKRYFALHEDKLVLKKAEEFLNQTSPKEHNLALMDLGSLICTPKNPTCKECPLSLTCKGKETPEFFTQKKKTQYESLELFLGVCVRDNKVALVKSQTNLYKGLLVLPSIEPDDEENFIASFKHSYTRYRINVKLYKSDIYDEECTWLGVEDMDDAPISSLTKKALKLLE